MCFLIRKAKKLDWIWVLPEKITVCFFQSPGKTTSVWNPLHYILCLRFFWIIQVTQITDQTEDWFLVADFQGNFFIFHSIPWTKTGKCSLLFFHLPCGRVYFSFSLVRGIFVVPALRGYLLLDSLPWPSSELYFLSLTCCESSDVKVRSLGFGRKIQGKSTWYTHLPPSIFGYFDVFKYSV